MRLEKSKKRGEEGRAEECKKQEQWHVLPRGCVQVLLPLVCWSWRSQRKQAECWGSHWGGRSGRPAASQDSPLPVGDKQHSFTHSLLLKTPNISSDCIPCLPRHLHISTDCSSLKLQLTCPSFPYSTSRLTTKSTQKVNTLTLSCRIQKRR